MPPRNLSLAPGPPPKENPPTDRATLGGWREGGREGRVRAVVVVVLGQRTALERSSHWGVGVGVGLREGWTASPSSDCVVYYSSRGVRRQESALSGPGRQSRSSVSVLGDVLAE